MLVPGQSEVYDHHLPRLLRIWPGRLLLCKLPDWVEAVASLAWPWQGRFEQLLSCPFIYVYAYNKVRV